jgi:uncharacterized protein (DUF486 family)
MPPATIGRIQVRSWKAFIAVPPTRTMTDPRMFPMPPKLLPILMLACSNVFMSFAWYGHLKYKSSPILLAVLVSWGIAFVEYCFAVPANRFGSEVYSTAQLKTIQEIVTLAVFAVFSVLYLGETFRWNHALGFALIAAGAFFIFEKW